MFPCCLSQQLCAVLWLLGQNLKCLCALSGQFVHQRFPSSVKGNQIKQTSFWSQTCCTFLLVTTVLCTKHPYPFCWLLYNAIQNEPTWKEKFLLVPSKLLNYLMDMPQTSVMLLLSHRSEPALLLLCILVVISTYAEKVKSPKYPLSCPRWSVLPPTTYTSNTRQQGNGCSKTSSPSISAAGLSLLPIDPFPAPFHHRDLELFNSNVSW